MIYKSNYEKGGFTLIELLVVIAIIAVLTAILTANFTSAKAKSRDAKRVSDMAQIQLALAAYYDRCNSYPPNLTDLTTPCAGAGLANNISLSTFISRIPAPPTTSETYIYNPHADSVQSGYYDDYFIGTSLETPGNVSNNSLSIQPSWYLASPSSYTTVQCDSSGQNYCVGPK